jgi:hypothetical protein
VRIKRSETRNVCDHVECPLRVELERDGSMVEEGYMCRTFLERPDQLS